MHLHWRAVLHEYAFYRNRLWLEASVVPLSAIVVDVEAMARLTSCLARLRESWRERGFVPLHADTRVHVERVVCDTGDAVELDVLCQLVLAGELHGEMLEEMRVEPERLRLEWVPAGRWVIAGVAGRGSEVAARTETPAAAAEPGSDAGGWREGRSAALAGAGSAQQPVVPALLLAPAIARPAPASELRIAALQPAPQQRSPRHYDRLQAVQYADRHWNRSNPRYATFAVDCTNFVSQCLFAGGIPMHYTGKRDSGWWYQGHYGAEERWSYSWAVADRLVAYLLSPQGRIRAREVRTPEQLQLGDVISYDWDGDGRFEHTVLVTSFDRAGMPLVHAHTTNSRYRYWSYTDSPAWTPRTRVRLIHLADEQA